MVRGLTLTYNDKEAKPSIRRYILEYLINLDRVLVNIKLASYIISSLKLY